MTAAPARTAEQRKKETLHRLEHDVDAWVATAAPEGGAPYLVPLSFLWDGTTLLLATVADSPTGRNLSVTGRVRLGIGPTRDVVILEGTVGAVTPEELPEEEAELFAAKTGFDPRRLATRYLYFRVFPRSIQAWREENELRGRDLMRDGRWLLDE
ncbi:pyridoxamine 5'-phosphate oxidase [Streptomyces pluripotens]|uniref:Pyridoxamine 5'-phosphate oxidase n=1 Tax=Streptomyces pluripotens TaxID=1355015 RepID=A0A221NSR7_9ACTN|nr:MULTISPECIES: pyridoxamine 5'-phosphate oxidase family protein [Streptomyces]ARP68787.1 pyridoxamine 5'-phosphate oxidase [Streptomyces pluripotens]ASN23043.1 pyridoxamine 5'-phosphate oxidase [Streptomyces pluripotens]KIE27817.1 pyridoxamine 5'-phosphate oxidase [Streptomyces sp. MUSC 125]MCH0558478.1 pyridoxamine 5'-phosphate oxidase family protein [Streptomyces sp. MUM 16J]